MVLSAIEENYSQGKKIGSARVGRSEDGLQFPIGVIREGVTQDSCLSKALKEMRANREDIRQTASTKAQVIRMSVLNGVWLTCSDGISILSLHLLGAFTLLPPGLCL